MMLQNDELSFHKAAAVVKHILRVKKPLLRVFIEFQILAGITTLLSSEK